MIKQKVKLIGYWNNDNNPDHAYRYFKTKLEADKIFDRANLLLIDTHDLRKRRANYEPPKDR